MHVNLRVGALLARDLLAAAGVDGSSSTYAEPDADGVKPVLRTVCYASISTKARARSPLVVAGNAVRYPQIFLTSLVALVRLA